MIKQIIMSLVIVLATFSTTSYADQTQFNGEFKITYGNKNHLCKDTKNILKKVTPLYLFYNDAWQKFFKTITWEQDDNTSPSIHLGKYVKIDIDNDQKNDVIVKETGMVGSKDMDRLYILEESKLKAARKEKKVSELLENSPILNPNYLITLENGQILGPVEINLFNHNDSHYLLMREFYFAREKSPVFNKLAIGIITKNSLIKARNNKTKGILVTLLCSIEG